MKTLLICLGLATLAGSASAFPRVFVAPPAVVVSVPVRRPFFVERNERPVRYVENRFSERREVIVRAPERVRYYTPVCRPVIVHPNCRR